MDSPSTRRATVKAPSTRPTVRPTQAAPGPPSNREPRSASSPRVGSFSYSSSDKSGTNSSGHSSGGGAPNLRDFSPRQQVTSGARKTFVAGADRAERSPLSRPVLPAARSSPSNDSSNGKLLTSSGRNSPKDSFSASAQRSQSEARPGADAAPKDFEISSENSEPPPSAAMSASPTSTRKFVPATDEAVEPELHQVRVGTKDIIFAMRKFARVKS